MIKEQEIEIWLKAYTAYIESGRGYDDVNYISAAAIQIADQCLKDLKDRFNLS
jgi:hypothetical protein